MASSCSFRRFLCYVAIAICVLVGTRAAPGNAATISEAEAEQVRVAFVYNFARFVSWTDNRADFESDPLELCIVARAGNGTEFTALQGRAVRDRKIHVNYLESVSPQAKCEIIFLKKSAAHRADEIIQFGLAQSALTISDTERFAHHGGTIGMVERRNKYRFEINLGAARQAGLQISSKLLKLAETIIQ